MESSDDVVDDRIRADLSRIVEWSKREEFKLKRVVTD